MKLQIGELLVDFYFAGGSLLFPRRVYLVERSWSLDNYGRCQSVQLVQVSLCSVHLY